MQALVDEKRANFAKYVKGLLDSKGLVSTEFRERLSVAENASFGEFMTYVSTEMVPYRSNPRAFVTKLLGDRIDDFSPPELERFKLYVVFFIESAA